MVQGRSSRKRRAGPGASHVKLTRARTSGPRDTPSFPVVLKPPVAACQLCAESSDAPSSEWGISAPRQWGLGICIKDDSDTQPGLKLTVCEVMGAVTSLNQASHPPLPRCWVPPTQPLMSRGRPRPQLLQTRRPGLAKTFLWQYTNDTNDTNDTNALWLVPFQHAPLGKREPSLDIIWPG